VSLEGLTAQTISSRERVVSRAVWEICCVYDSISAGEIFVGFRHFAQQRHFASDSPELIVQVAGDAGAFLFQRGLLLQLAPQLLGGKIPHHGNDGSHQA